MDPLLTDRQAQCLRLSANMTDKEIARELGLSPHTVNLHIRNAMKKLGASNRREALRTLAEKPHSGSNAIALPATHAATSSGCGSPVADKRQSGLDVRNWIYTPVLLPTPPKRWPLRIWMTLAASLAILMIGASALGLLGLVLDVVNRWAAEPTMS